MKERTIIPAVFALAVFAFAAPARAGDPGDEDAARAAMRRGAAALEAGESARALTEYTDAKRLAPAANAPWFFAGEALARLERWPEAVESFEGYLAKDPSVSDAVAVRARVAKIRAEHFPAHLRVIVGAPGAEVSVDRAAAVPPGQLDVAPGRHHLDAQAPGYDPAATDIDVVGDTTSTVTLVLSLHTPPAPAPPPPEHPAAPPPAEFPWRTAGWIAAGVGAAGLVTTVILDVVVLGGKRDDLDRAYDHNEAEAERGLVSEMRTLQIGLLVGYVASGLVTATGVAVALLGPRPPPAAPRGPVGLAPLAGPKTAGLMAVCRF